MPTLPEQGRGDLHAPPPMDLGELIKFRDPERKLPVYLCVHPSESSIFGATSRDLHWSIGWHVADETPTHSKDKVRPAWRQIHTITHSREYDPPPQPRLVFWGTITSFVGERTKSANKFELGIMSLQERRRIEELALQVPVMEPDGTWNCQDFLKDLLGKMVEAKIMDKATKDSVIRKAEKISP